MFKLSLVMGFTTKDAEMQISEKTGRPYLKFSIARREKPEAPPIYSDVLVMDDLAEHIGQVKKGTNIVVFGEEKESSYTGNDGVERKSSTIMAYWLRKMPAFAKREDQ